MAVSSSCTDNRIMTSANGITWTVSYTGLRSIFWPLQCSQFAAVSNSDAGNRVMMSP